MLSEDQKSLRYQHQFIQPANHLLQLHPTGQSLFVPPRQQQSLCLKKQLLSLRHWELIWSLDPATGPLCGVASASDLPLSLELGSVDLWEGGQGGERGEKRREGGGVQCTLQHLSTSSSVICIPSTSPLSFLGHNMKAIQTGTYIRITSITPRSMYYTKKIKSKGPKPASNMWSDL